MTSVCTSEVLSLRAVKSKQKHLDKAFLQDLARRFSIRGFVETGTYLGDSTAVAAEVFHEVHSIELSEELAARARTRFSFQGHVRIYQGDSGQRLPEIIRNLEGLALFWLDGHYSCGITAKGEVNTPILDELRAIHELCPDGAILLIDDLRMFDPPRPGSNAPPPILGYPAVKDLYRVLADMGYQLVILGDVGLAVPSKFNCTFSPVVMAMTLSRLYDGANLSIEEVIEAEKVLVLAQGSEKDVLRGLCGLYNDFEPFGLGLHYRLWRGLSLLQDDNLIEAAEEFERVALAGFAHWRLKWYLALIRQRQNRREISINLLDQLLAEAPNFKPARELRHNLASRQSKAPKSNHRAVFDETWNRMQAEYYDLCAALEKTGATRKEALFVHSSWRDFKSRIRKLLLGSPNQNFLDDPTLNETMVRRGFRISQEFELSYLQNCISNRARNMLAAFQDADVSLPRECSALNCSVNTLGHLFYAVKTLEQYGVEAPRLIVEFGAGYGNLARVFKHFVPGSTLVLIDLPELLALQYLFLRTTSADFSVHLHREPPFRFVPGSVNLVPAYYLEEISLSADLFVSTFALSEAPSAVQTAIVDKQFFGARLTYLAGQLQGASPTDNWVDHRFLHQAVRSQYPQAYCQPFHVFQNGVMLYEIMGTSSGPGLEKSPDSRKVNFKEGCPANQPGSVHGNSSAQIVVKLQGGLGNQMFQYAAGLALARRQGGGLKLDLGFLQDRTPRPNFTYRDYCLDLFTLAPDCEVLDKSANLGSLPKFVEQQFHFDPRFLELKGDLYLDGYWQSPRFFESIEQEIRSTFSSFATPLNSEQEALAKQIESTESVCLNVRRGDYVSNPVAQAWHGVCQPSYFQAAVAWIRNRRPNARFFVFSDDVQWCENAHLVGDAPVTYVSHEYAGDRFGAYLQLMTRCRHFVLPNSSFGWWAAFLATATDKIVIVPEPWFDNPSNDTSDLLPAGWIRLPKHESVAPKVSVVISSHNYAQFLPEAFESVAKQTFRDFEILLIDDGSTDNSLQVSQALAARYQAEIPTRVFRLDNVGPSRARGFGAKQARGRYWLPLDADDRIAPDYLEKTVPVLDAQSALGFVYVDTVYFAGVEKRHQQPEYDFKKLCQDNFISYCSLIRKAAFDEVGGYDPENWGYYEDWDLWIRLGARGWSGHHVAEPLFFYRHHFESSLSLYSQRLGPVYRAFLTKQHAELYSPDVVKQADTILAEIPFDWHRQPPMRDPQALRRLLEQYPQNRHLTFFLALSLFQAGRFNESGVVVKELLSFAPNDGDGQQLLQKLATVSKDSPMVSVIVPTHNRPEQLEHALQSILNQTFQDFEIIVVNDAGSDVDPVVKRLNRGPQIVSLRHDTNRGLAAARNTGLRVARGRYIAYLDDDDLFYPNHLETLVDFLQAHPGTVAYTDSNQALQEFVDGSWQVTQRKVLYSEDWNNDEVLTRNLVPVICFMHEKQALERSGGFDETLDRHEDWDLWIRLSRDCPFVHIPEVTCEFSFRNDGSSMTGQGALRFLSTMERIHARYAPLVQDRPDLAYAQWLIRDGLHTRNASTREGQTPGTKSLDRQFLPSEADFDEARYLAQYPDVAAAVGKGVVKSGWHHFLQSGVSEKRRWYHRHATPSVPGVRPTKGGDSNLHETATAAPAESRAVSIVIPVFNRLDMTQRCLQSIRTNSSETDYEVIVVDNGSTDGSADWVRQFRNGSDRFRLIQNSKNLGFARASNQGAEAARGKHVIFLNNDTEVTPGWLPPLISIAEQDSSVGAVGCKLLFPDRSIQHAGVVISVQAATGHIGPFHIYYKKPADLSEANQLREYNVCTGACLLVPTSLLKELNGFDENFWNGYEDVDLCLRIRQKGLRVIYQPASVVIHYESQSGAERFSKEQRNIDLLQKKWRQKVSPDVIVERDGKAQLQPTTGIKPYQSPNAVSVRPGIRSLPGPGSNTTPLLTVVIPTFNKLSLTKQCLTALHSDSSWKPLEIVVVDNGSTDGTTQFLTQEQEAGRLRAVLNEGNRGFACACNQGARSARGKYIVFLNNDTEVRPGWLSALVGTAEADSNVGAVGSKLLFPDSTIQHAGVVLLDDRKLRDPLLARHVFERAPQDQPEANRPMCYQALTGACLLVPTRLFLELGGFDEGFWNGYEDIDLCFRIAQAGRVCVYQPASVVLHHESQSGPERFRKVKDNVSRLHQKWLGRVNPDFVAGIDGSLVKTDANRIRAYSRALPAVCQVSILIPVLNQLDHTRKCLESLAANTPLPHEIIVVDNGSTDATPEFLKQWKAGHPNLTIIRNARNVGFAAANNQALSLAKGANVLMLNNDTVVAAGWLEGLLRVLEQHPETGIVGPMSNNVSGPQWVTGHDYQGLAHLSAFAAAWAKAHDDQSIETPRAVGFCLLARRELINQIGGLDERFGSGNFEDDDFCVRARIAGFKVRIAKEVFIHHTGSQTFKGANINYREAMLRNWDIFRSKWQLPAEVKLENGYPVPKCLPTGVPLRLELPSLAKSHELRADGFWQARPCANGVKKDRVVPRVGLLGQLDEARKLSKRGELAAAWKATLEAIGQRPFHPQAFLLFAQIAAAVGDVSLARRCVNRACDLAPGLKKTTKGALKSSARQARPDWLALPEAVLPTSAGMQKKVHLSVCLIVKDEEQHLARCLESIRGLAAQVVVVDTGSSDQTVEVAKRFGAEVYHFEWCDDFAAARNAALEHARGDWVLMLDADEELSPDQHARLKADMKNGKAIALRLPLINAGKETEGRSFVPRLFRNAPGVYYSGRIHEQVFHSLIALGDVWGLGTGLGTAQILHHGYTKQMVKDRNKIDRNLNLLRQAIEESPEDANLVMNLGLELVRYGNLGEGLDHYREAFRLISHNPATATAPELREALLTQFTSHLYKVRAHQEIVEVLTSAIVKSTGLTASLHFALGLAFFELGRFSEAAEQIRQCISTRQQPALTPINTDILSAAPFHCLAMSLAKEGNPTAAEKAFRAGMTEKGHQEKLRLDYARFLAGQNRQVDAFHCLHEMVTSDPKCASAWHLGAEMALGRAEFLEFACDWTSQAMLNLPEDHQIASQRAEALLLSGQTAPARDVWKLLSRVSQDPRSQAALLFCSIVENQPVSDLGIYEAEVGPISRALIDWYQQGLNRGAQTAIKNLNGRIENLRVALPGAAALIETALAEVRAEESPVVEPCLA